MSRRPPQPKEMLRGNGSGGWEPVEVGQSGADVYRSTDGQLHVKCVAADRTAELAKERDKVAWLTTTPIVGPHVVDWVKSADGAVLVMTTVPGLAACHLSRELVPPAVTSMAELLRRLHDLPIADCPFVRRLVTTVSTARRAVGSGSVEVTDFDYSRLWRTPDDLLRELEDGLPQAADLEARDLVVCHGDPCLPNVLFNPETGEATGLVDLGRLGVADRYLDLALVTRSMAAPEMNDQYEATDAVSLLAQYGISTPDLWRLEYYRLLDEFF